jgi:fluoride ion exporter CrcB/FEX
LLRQGAWVRAVANIVLSVLLCVAATAMGHWMGQRIAARSMMAAINTERRDS